MKKRLLVILVATTMIACSCVSMSFAGVTKTATFYFSAETPIVGGSNVDTLDLTDEDVTLHIEDRTIYWDDYGNYCLYIHGSDHLTKITVPTGKKITGLQFLLGSQNYDEYCIYYGFQHYYEKYSPSEVIPGTEGVNNFIAKANGIEVELKCIDDSDIEYYYPADIDTLTEFTIEVDSSTAPLCLTGIAVTYEDAETTALAKNVGADTGDSNNIALFGIMGILALFGSGFIYKRREN